MPRSFKRPMLWMFALAIVIFGIAGGAGEAAAQVYTGTLQFNSLPALNLTVTLHPGGPATYTATFNGRTIDFGFIVASVAGNSVAGFQQSTRFAVRQCNFQGTYDGTTAVLFLDPVSCGDGGTVTLTRTS
jgi:hypothetical protein